VTKTAAVIRLNEKPALSLAEAGKVAGCGRTSIYKATIRGGLVARKIGRRTVILRADLDRWLAALPAKDGKKAGVA